MPRHPKGETQSAILSYIEKYTAEHGYAPSVREIGEAVDLRSTSTVHGHLNRLEKKGLLHRQAMKSRTVDVIRPEDGSTVESRSVPLIGKVAAGLPILAEENLEAFLSLPDTMLGSGEYFALRINGSSMIEAGILNDDIVIVRQQQTAVNGEIVIAMIDGEATCKRFFNEKDRIRLQPENREMSPIYSSDVLILGKVVSLLRMSVR